MERNAVEVSHDHHTCTRPIRALGCRTWCSRPMGARHRPAVDISRWLARLRSVGAEKAKQEHLGRNLRFERWSVCRSHQSRAIIHHRPHPTWGRRGRRSGRRRGPAGWWRRWSREGRCWWTSPPRSSQGWGLSCQRPRRRTWKPSWRRSTTSSTCRVSWSRPRRDTNTSKPFKQSILPAPCLYCDKYI